MNVRPFVLNKLFRLFDSPLAVSVKPLLLGERRGFSCQPVESDDSDKERLDYYAICKGDESLVKKLKILELEAEVLRQEGKRVPDKITPSQWSDLLVLPSLSQRIKHLGFLWLNIKRKEKDKERKEKRKAKKAEEVRVKEVERQQNDHIHYGFGGNTIFMRIYESKIDKFYNSGLIQAMMFGQKLIVDCGYDKHMNIQESSNCAKQLMIMFSENRTHKQPFDLHFCNARKEDKVIQRLHKIIPTLHDADFPLNITEKSYLDLFPKENLVYLTPHCREELKSFSHDDIYIIGGLVDKVNNEPLSLGKAKSEGIRMRKLPLDRYLSWNLGSKSLTLNQVLGILLDLQVTGDWHSALRHVPIRKLTREDNRGHKPPERRMKSYGRN